MKKFNVVTGLPRAGSTLMCNILNQHPQVYASSTSPVPPMCGLLSNYWSNSPEVKSMLIRDQKATGDRLVRSMRALVKTWYAKQGPVVFDKSRGWSNNALLLSQLYPDATMVVIVRELRAVFGSIEKQHQRNPILDHAQHPLGKTLYERADQMFSADIGDGTGSPFRGVIGVPVYCIEDLVRRRPKNVMFVRYEDFAREPKAHMAEINTRCGLAPFEHDFENVVNVAEDVDELYLGKYEHKGEGKVEPRDPNEWRQYVSEDIAELIMDRYPFYNEAFGYGRRTPTQMPGGQ